MQTLFGGVVAQHVFPPPLPRGGSSSRIASGPMIARTGLERYRPQLDTRGPKMISIITPTFNEEKSSNRRFGHSDPP